MTSRTSSHNGSASGCTRKGQPNPTAGVTGARVHDIMFVAIERRFGDQVARADVNWCLHATRALTTRRCSPIYAISNERLLRMQNNRTVKRVFAAFPFSEEYSYIEDAIKRGCEGVATLECAKDLLTNKHILDKILGQMRSADLCLFDLSGHNVNVAL